MVRHHIACKLVKVAGPSVVAESGPRFTDPSRGCPGEMMDGGVGAEEPRPVSLDAAHLGLLEHDFGDEYAVGITGAAPRQVAAVTAEPREQPALELPALCGGWNGRGFHGLPR